MPNRILREGILTSERVNVLSWPAEVFYRRLMSAVDDFGRFWAKPDLLRAALFPLQLEKVGNQDAAKWLTECVRAGLVRAYTVEKKDYLQLLDFRQHVRAQASKYPQPPSTSDADAAQVHSKRTADAHVYGVVDEDVGKPLAPRDDSRSAINGNAVAYIPLNDGSEFGISIEHVAEFEKAYPAVDCKQTLQEIRAWCVSNSTKRKTRGGVLRFVNSWLGREQNKAR